MSERPGLDVGLAVPGIICSTCSRERVLETASVKGFEMRCAVCWLKLAYELGYRPAKDSSSAGRVTEKEERKT